MFYNNPLRTNLVVRPTDYILTSADVEPVLTLAEVKDYLRIASGETAFDDNLTLLISTATTLCEKITGRDLITKSYTAYLDCFPSTSGFIEIEKAKIQSIVSIAYYSNNILTVFDSTTYYKTNSDNYSKVLLLEGNTWPSTDKRAQAISMDLTVGYGPDPENVPGALKRALLANIAALYANVGDCGDCTGFEAGSQAIQLYQPFVISNLLFSVV